MSQSSDTGVILALIDRFEKERLPRLLELKEKVGSGDVLSEADIDFLGKVTHDAQQNKALIDRHPEWHEFCANVIHLYEEIIDQAFENEKRR